MTVPYLTETWSVSPYNFMNEVRSEMHLPAKVIIHDSTLRDGEQHPGIVFRKEDKIQIAKALDEYGVHRIEVMPVVSSEDLEAIIEMRGMGLKAEVVGFCRSNVDDVAVAIKSGVSAVVIEMYANPYYLHVVGWSLEQAEEKVIKAIQYAKENGLRVTFFIVDSSRTEFDILKKFIEDVVAKGQPDSICLADTKGVLIPQAAYHLVRKVKEYFKLPVEIHTHNNFGFGTANAFAAVCAGAEVVHSSVNGLGSQAGNAPLEEIALDLKVMLGMDIGINYEKTYELCKLVEKLSGVTLESTKPLVGDKVFTSDTGIMVSRLLKLKEQGLPLVPYSDNLMPEFIGRTRDIMLGKKSGRASVEYKLKELGMNIPSEDELREILGAVKEYSLKNKTAVSNDAFVTIVNRVLSSGA